MRGALNQFPATPDAYPSAFGQDIGRNTLCAGTAQISPVLPEVFQFDVSAFKVLSS